MRRFIAVILFFFCAFAFETAAFAQHHSSGSHSSKSHSSKTKDSVNKTVHVHGYYRKDGTYVAPYERSAPGTAAASSPSSTRVSSAGRPYRKNYVAEGYTLHPSVQHDKHGRIKRITSAKSAFERRSPCPSTGKTSGRCPGYVVDHVNPLECGGADAPSNMQWQTTAAAKAKDKTKRNCRL
jgi:hypothetical protein